MMKAKNKRWICTDLKIILEDNWNDQLYHGSWWVKNVLAYNYYWNEYL